jgi:hypothetical protein
MFWVYRPMSLVGGIWIFWVYRQMSLVGGIRMFWVYRQMQKNDLKIDCFISTHANLRIQPAANQIYA